MDLWLASGFGKDWGRETLIQSIGSRSVNGQLFDLAFAEAASQSSWGGVGDKRTMPGVTEGSQGNWASASLGAWGAYGSACSYTCRNICTVACAMQKRVIGH